MRTNEAGRKLIRDFEGLELSPYKCSADVWTQGWGRAHGITRFSPPITVEQADAWFEEDLLYAESIVEQHVTVPLNENQHAAIVSFIFNLGPGKRGYKDGFVWLKSGRHSSMLTLLNQGSHAAAAQEFKKWTKAGGKDLPGLVRRRKAEAELFMKPTEG